MPAMTSRTTYLACAAGLCLGIILFIWLDGVAVIFASLPIGLSLGTALRTWWRAHGWNPGITITEDREDPSNAGGPARKM